MVRRLKETRDGLTACPACNTHIRVAENPIETVCPFCSAALKDHVSGGPSWVSRVTQAGRSGVVAASLLGLTGMAGCVETVAPVYGAPPVDTMVSDAGEDASPQPAYGLAADTTIEVDTAPDLGPQPEYGIPSDPNP